MSIPSLLASTVRRRRHSLLLGTADYTGSTLTSSVFALTANGSATTTLTGTVYRNGELASGVPVTFTVERTFVSASVSTVTATGTILNDGTDAAFCGVRVLDADGNPLPGIPASACVMAVSGTGNTLTQPTGSTNADGWIYGSFVSTNAATKTVSWTVAGLAITATSSVVVSGVAPAWPNEPSGYTAWGEHNLSALPSGSNGTTGTQWYNSESVTGNMAIVSEASAPYSPTSVIQITYPDGFGDGDSPSRFSLQNTTQRQKVYTSFWWRIKEATYENQSVFTKLCFWGYGTTGGGAYNEGFLALVSPSAGRTHSEFKLEYRQQNNVSRNLAQNVNTSALLTCTDWHQIEVVMELNSAAGVADGLLQWWVDGTLVGQYTDMVYITTGNTQKFAHWKFDPTYGGNSGETKTGEANWQIDHVYLSGVV